jgi:hypothetical protein
VCPPVGPPVRIPSKTVAQPSLKEQLKETKLRHVEPPEIEKLPASTIDTTELKKVMSQLRKTPSPSERPVQEKQKSELEMTLEKRRQAIKHEDWYFRAKGRRGNRKTRRILY